MDLVLPQSFVKDSDALVAGHELIAKQLPVLCNRFRCAEKWHPRRLDKDTGKSFFALSDISYIIHERDDGSSACTTISSYTVEVFKRCASQWYDVEEWSDIMGSELRFFKKDGAKTCSNETK